MRRPRYKKINRSPRKRWRKPDILRKFPKDNTVRWCGGCEAVTEFKYNRALGHSECKVCGWRKIKY